jgi:hypothetical protein
MTRKAFIAVAYKYLDHYDAGRIERILGDADIGWDDPYELAEYEYKLRTAIELAGHAAKYPHIWARKDVHL